VSLLPGGFEICDCHSHVYGPFERFPLSNERMFDPPNSPIDALERVWKSSGITRGVLIQGSGYGGDHRALLDAIALDPRQRRGVAVLDLAVSDDELYRLRDGGIRGVRFHWVNHQSLPSLIESASTLAKRVFALGWHIEVHVDADSLGLVEQLELPAGQMVVIDHMARVDAALGMEDSAFQRLIALLEREHVWVKLSGADRIVRNAGSLAPASEFMARLAERAPTRCVWGLDWPHVNLSRVYGDNELVATLRRAIPDVGMLEQILYVNPARLYDFPVGSAVAEENNRTQGAVLV
jgi:2-pyrone-4,6-dicarboxylate lactonase